MVGGRRERPGGGRTRALSSGGPAPAAGAGGRWPDGPTGGARQPSALRAGVLQTGVLPRDAPAPHALSLGALPPGVVPGWGRCSPPGSRRGSGDGRGWPAPRRRGPPVPVGRSSGIDDPPRWSAGCWRAGIREAGNCGTGNCGTGSYGTGRRPVRRDRGRRHRPGRAAHSWSRRAGKPASDRPRCPTRRRSGTDPVRRRSARRYGPCAAVAVRGPPAAKGRLAEGACATGRRRSGTRPPGTRRHSGIPRAGGNQPLAGPRSSVAGQRAPRRARPSHQRRRSGYRLDSPILTFPNVHGNVVASRRRSVRSAWRNEQLVHTIRPSLLDGSPGW